MPRARRLLAILPAFFLGSCFQPPVIEVLLLRFLPEGGATAALEVQLADPKQVEGAGVERRMRDRESALLSGADPWLERFDAIAAPSDALEWHRQEGRLRSFSRSLEVDDPAALDPLFAADGATWAYERDGAVADLQLFPARASRAPKRDRDRTLRELDRWAGRYVEYVAAARALDEWAVGHPSLAREVWRAALRSDDAEPGSLPEEETALAARVEAALTALLEPFEADPREGYSLDERLREAFDPFAAQLGIELPCKADRVEGFVEVESSDYVVPELSITEAVARLEGRWLSPDPLRALLGKLRAADAELTPELYSAQRSIATEAPPPDSREVARAFAEALRPPPVYRLTWSCVSEKGEKRAEGAP